MLEQLSSIIGLSTNPGCVVPSMVTGSMILGSFDSGVIVFAPAGEMLNVIVSAPGLTFASEIAFLREPIA